MRKLLSIVALVALALCALPAMAQSTNAGSGTLVSGITVPASNSTPKLSVSTGAVYWRGAGQNWPGTDAVGLFKVQTIQAKTPIDLFVRSDNWIIPAPGIEASTGGLMACAQVDTNWSACGNAGVGAISSPTPTHFAANFGFRLNRLIKGKLDWNVADIQGVYGRYTLAASTGVNPASATFSLSVQTALQLSF